MQCDKHKPGIQANLYMQEFGQRLLPEIYALYNPLNYVEASSLEVLVYARMVESLGSEQAVV